MDYSAKRVYEIEQQKLLLDFEKIALFTNHPTSLGTFRESRLRQYLREFTPRQLEMGMGFVTAYDASNRPSQSRQVDCLVFDESKRHPELRTPDYAIVQPEAVFAAIEVKSELTFHREFARSDVDLTDTYPHEDVGRGRFRWAGTLVDALANIKSVIDVIGMEDGSVFYGVFGYSASFEVTTLWNAFHAQQLQSQLRISHVSELPYAICVPGKMVIHPSAYDFMEPNPHHEPFTSFLNVLSADVASAAYPLQFFTSYYLNQVGHRLNGRPPTAGGLNHGSTEGSGIKIWRDHFRLDSRGFEDQ